LFDQNVLPGFYDWQVLHTPGHTDHDICLYNSKKKILYLADMVVQVNGRCVLPFPVVFPDKMKESLIRLSCLEINTLLQAHGESCVADSYGEFLRNLAEKTNHQLKGQFRFLRLFIRLSRHARR
jgi:glyoxylase-like metal-dependent hydrolase (beta-lactamase superfamily II)